MALDPLKPREVSELRAIGVNAGWTLAKTANLSKFLGRAKGLAFPTPTGWRLTDEGCKHIAAFASVTTSAVPTGLTQSLRKHAAKIADANTKGFVEEAISCAEHGYWRAAVVLSWVGAVSVLYDYVVAKKLAEFNAEAVKRNVKWKQAATKGDLAKMEEYDFLQVLAAISVIDKNVKLELEPCLKRRNGCGHPNTLKIGDATVAHHLEVLILNVFEKF